MESGRPKRSWKRVETTRSTLIQSVFFLNDIYLYTNLSYRFIHLFSATKSHIPPAAQGRSEIDNRVLLSIPSSIDEALGTVGHEAGFLWTKSLFGFYPFKKCMIVDSINIQIHPNLNLTTLQTPTIHITRHWFLFPTLGLCNDLHISTR